MEIILSNQQLSQKLKKNHSDSNFFALPRIKSVTVYIGTGRIKDDKDSLSKIQSVLTNLTGQKWIETREKKSIATFKVRQGQSIGYKVTLRGKRGFEFLAKLFHVAIPRIRDFRGLKTSLINQGSFNLGIKESFVFPEMNQQSTDSPVSLQVTIAFNNNQVELNREAIEALGGKFIN